MTEDPAHTAVVPRARTSRLVGAGALVSGVVSVCVLALDGEGEIGGAFSHGLTIYGRSHAVVASSLVLAGLLLLALRRRDLVAGLGGVVVLCAAVLAGTGIVGGRRWPLYWGCCAPREVTEQFVRTLATAMGVVCGVTAIACVVLLISGGFARLDPLAGGVAIPTALAVAVVGPRLMVGGWEDHRELVAWAVMYSLPISGALVLSSALERWAAMLLITAAAGYALLATAGRPFINSSQMHGDEAAATWMVVVACLVVALPRLARPPKAPRAASGQPVP